VPYYTTLTSDPEEPSDWIALSSAVATFLSVIIAVVALWTQLKKLNDSLTI
jgi:hypothetical protein